MVVQSYEEILKDDILNGVVRHGGYILSDGTLNTLHLLAKAHDFLQMYNVNDALRKSIWEAISVRGWDGGEPALPQPLWPHVYHDRAELTGEHAEELWHEDIFNYLDSLSPEGYYFGASEGDGSCFGWWKNEEV